MCINPKGQSYDNLKTVEIHNCNVATDFKKCSLGSLILEWVSPESPIRGRFSEVGRLGRAAMRAHAANPLPGVVLKSGTVPAFGEASCVLLDSGSTFLLFCRAKNALAVAPAFLVDDSNEDDPQVIERLSVTSFVASVLAIATARCAKTKAVMGLLGLGALADELSGIRVIKVGPASISAVTWELAASPQAAPASATPQLCYKNI